MDMVEGHSYFSPFHSLYIMETPIHVNYGVLTMASLTVLILAALLMGGAYFLYKAFGEDGFDKKKGTAGFLAFLAAISTWFFDLVEKIPL